ncbi:T9SS type A sorting domain-containing protein [Algibacter miyuki]|uniref:T9SS type A sorting domain-containing protein n=1 Tax=Algibacter miyuki TaxID=1306933 RepID=A0ABV5H0B9_9FLAO|nr:T9SS type A sorting domain-containing protein [Algibacter miyuki]MDN3667600.1 T9SS type A sorting domain-containing protein [Algibacter miyuki]
MKHVLLLCFCCAFLQQVSSQSNSILRSTTGVSGASNVIVNANETYTIQQSIGQTSAIGTFNNDNYTLRQGFIQPNILSKIVEKNIPINLQLTLYPNPFDEQISLAFTDNIKGEIIVTVYNILGAKVYNHNYQPLQKIDVRLDLLSTGEYILKTIANNKQFITKIIKK